MRSLLRALVLNERIETTLPRAKELRPAVEKMVTKALRGNDLTAIRELTADMGGQVDVARKMIKDIAPKYKDRKGGYTRIMKLPNRLSDGSEMALIEFV